MRSRNKKSTEGGSESGKNQTSLSTRDYLFSCLLPGAIPDPGMAFVQLCHLLLSHMPLTLTLPNNFCLAEELDVNGM